MSNVDVVEAVIVESIPEKSDRIQNLPPSLNELSSVKVWVEVDVFEFFQGVPSVLRLNAVVPGKERQTQVRVICLFDAHQTIFQFLPEASRRPVLDRKTGTFGDVWVVAAVKSYQLVAEVQGCGSTMLAFADVCVGQTQPLSHADQPFKMSCSKTANASVHRAFGVDQFGVALPVLFLLRLGNVTADWLSRLAVDYTQLV